MRVGGHVTPQWLPKIKNLLYFTTTGLVVNSFKKREADMLVIDHLDALKSLKREFFSLIHNNGPRGLSFFAEALSTGTVTDVQFFFNDYTCVHACAFVHLPYFCS